MLSFSIGPTEKKGKGGEQFPAHLALFFLRGLFPLLADSGPAGQLLEPGGKVLHGRRNVDVLGADLCTGTAADTVHGPLPLREAFGTHNNAKGRLQPEVIVDGEESRNIQFLRAAVAAVAAAGAGQGVFELVGGVEYENGLFSVERFVFGEGLHVVSHLFQIGHAAEDHLHIGQVLQKRIRTF